jgi:hypothetical protein
MVVDILCEGSMYPLPNRHASPRKEEQGHLQGWCLHLGNHIKLPFSIESQVTDAKRCDNTILVLPEGIVFGGICNDTVVGYY